MTQSFPEAKSLRQCVQTLGTVESVQLETRQFMLRLINEQPVPCLLVEGDMSTVEALLGKRAFISGMGVWQPWGRLVRVEVVGIWPGEGERDVWSWLPEPNFPSDLAPDEPTPRPFFGPEAFPREWPGDETDEELLKALKEMDR